MDGKKSEKLLFQMTFVKFPLIFTSFSRRQDDLVKFIIIFTKESNHKDKALFKNWKVIFLGLFS